MGARNCQRWVRARLAVLGLTHLLRGRIVPGPGDGSAEYAQVAVVAREAAVSPRPAGTVHSFSDAGESEVDDLDRQPVALRLEQQVGGLEVEVDHPGRGGR
jgi:hypothetical protein